VSADALAAAPRRRRRADRLALAAIVGLALLVRVLYARHVGDDPLLGDGLEFHLSANLLADGHGFVDPFAWARGVAAPSADKPPLYGVTLAALSLLGLRSPGEHHVSGVLTGVLLVGVVGALAREVTGRRAAGLLAAGACALYPPLVMADGSLRSESLFALLIACAVLAAVRYRHRPGRGWAAAAGAAVALAALTRGEAALLLVLLPLALWRAPAPQRPRLAHLGVAFAVVVVVLAPWLVRCWSTFGQPVIISTNTGGLLAGANCPETYRGLLIGQWSLRCAEAQTSVGTNEARVANALRARGLRYAADHAGRLPVVLAARAGRTLELYHPRRQAREQRFFEGRDVRVAELGVPAFWLVAALALATLALRAVPRGDALLLWAPVAVVGFVTLTAYGWTRFRAGAEPELLVLAAAAVVALADRRATS
jgi:4-amino-4-deoxy-L-arabinose transferase-like glycosyltransferase